MENWWRVGGNAVSLGIFSSWCVTNVTTVTFNYILVIVSPFPLNIGVSPSFHCTVLVPVYRVYTSCFHNTIVSSCYRLHTFCLHHAVLLLVSVWTYGFNLFLKYVISQELMRVHTYSLTYGQSIMICFYMMGLLGANFTLREVASSVNSYANCHYDIYQGTLST